MSRGGAYTRVIAPFLGTLVVLPIVACSLLSVGDFDGYRGKQADASVVADAGDGGYDAPDRVPEAGIDGPAGPPRILLGHFTSSGAGTRFGSGVRVTGHFSAYGAGNPSAGRRIHVEGRFQ